MQKTFFITGGCGFIGSALINFLIKNTEHKVINLDKITSISNKDALKKVSENKRYKFIQGDVCDQKLILNLLSKFCPDSIIHLAAETHVDRSIDSSKKFIKTNILGTFTLLECTRKYLKKKKNNFIFHHVSTDEVYGSLNNNGFFTEKSKYDPSSPYSASKASSDHLVRAWYKTYGVPVIISNCSNNYGPYQFPEKLIPLAILNALEKKPIPVYGSGLNVRDWLYVEDHVEALYLINNSGKVGNVYNVGGFEEKKNIDVVNMICEFLDIFKPLKNLKVSTVSNPKIKSYKDLIRFVDDRPGHDYRYSINSSKIQKELLWKPKETFKSGIKKTIEWYISNLDWCKKIQGKKFNRQRLWLSYKKNKKNLII